MHSAAAHLGQRSLAVLLSGDKSDGSSGMDRIIEKNGRGIILNPAHCLHKHMVTNPAVRHNLRTDLDEFSLAAEIRKNHFLNKEIVVTA